VRERATPCDCANYLPNSYSGEANRRQLVPPKKKSSPLKERNMYYRVHKRPERNMYYRVHKRP